MFTFKVTTGKRTVTVFRPEDVLLMEEVPSAAGVLGGSMSSISYNIYLRGRTDAFNIDPKTKDALFRWMFEHRDQGTAEKAGALDGQSRDNL